MVENLQANSGEFGSGVLSDDTGVAANLDLVGSSADGAVQNDDLLGCARNSCSKLGVGGNSGGGSTCSSSGAAVKRGVS